MLDSGSVNLNHWLVNANRAALSEVTVCVGALEDVILARMFVLT